MSHHTKGIMIGSSLFLLFFGYFFVCSSWFSWTHYLWIFPCKEAIERPIVSSNSNIDSDISQNPSVDMERLLQRLQSDPELRALLRGADGRDGTPGRRGQDGRDGADGQDGRDGADGKDGSHTQDSVDHDEQQLAFDDTTGILSLTRGGTVDLSSYITAQDANTTYTAGNGLTLSGTVFDADDPLIGNEVLDATVGGGLERSGSGSSTAPYTLGLTTTCNDGDVLVWDAGGSTWTCRAPALPAPFISSPVISMATSATRTITLLGYNFIPTTAVAIPGFDGTVDSVNVLSPGEIEVTLTAGATSATYDIVLSNDGVLNTLWTGNGDNLLSVSSNDGTSNVTPGESCKDILDNGFSTGDGLYWIDPNGGATSDSFQVYCDMTTDGGGWTRIAYAADLPHQAQFGGGDANRWLTSDFSLVLSDAQINDIRSVSTEGKQRYHGTCQGVIHYKYQTSNYAYAFGFRFHNGDETAFNQQYYPSTTITVPNDGCQVNNNTMQSTDFDIVDIRVPVINVHSRDNSSSEEFGSPLTNYPAWLR